MFNLKKFFLKEEAANVSSTIQDLTSPVNEAFSRINPVENLTSAQKAKFNDRAQTLSVYLLQAALLLTPLLFVPILIKSFDLPKQSFLLITGLILAVILSVKMVAAKKLNLVLSIFDAPIILFVIASVVSAYLTTNRFMSLVSDPLTYAGAALLFFVITQTVKKQETLIVLIKTILASGVILAAVTTVQLVINLADPTLNLGPLTPFLSFNFNLTGSVLTQALFFAAILPLAIGLYLKNKSQSNLFLTIANVIGAVVSLYILYRFNPAILPFDAGWKIATGTLGQTMNAALFGVGPSNFVDAFTLYRPMSLNMTNLWNLRFTSGGPFFFYILTTLGIFGLSALVYLVYRIIKLALKRFELETISVLEKATFVSLFVTILIFAFLPSPTVLTMTFFAVLGFLVAQFSLSENTFVARQKTIALPENFIVNSLVPLGVIAITAFVAYQLGRVLFAEYLFSQSLYAAQANRGTETYNLQIQAITLNPMDDSYRATYAQTNLALADSLANQKSLTDEQKSMVTQLVQQAIREARNAVSLAPQRAADWENLAQVYRSLINFAQGADQWTVASYNQAITLDPNNAQLRFTLGTLFFFSKDYQTAAQAFSLAATLKPDYANAHYNLTQALKSLNLNDQALKELQLTSSLICTTKSADCDKVNAKIAGLGTQSQNATGSADLNSPLSTASAANKNLQKAKTTPPIKISTPSGQIQP